MDSLDRLKKINRSFLFKLTGRTSLFLFLLSTFLIVLYVSGSYQDFLDSTLNFVLTSCSATILGLFVFSAAGILQSIILFFISKRKSYWIYFFVYILSCVFSAGFFFLARTISIIAKGI